MRLTLCWLLLLLSSVVAAEVGVAPPPPDTGPGLLFHVSFDKDRRADHAVGRDLPVMARYARQNRTAEGGTHVDGVFGKALTGRCGRLGSGDYDALGNFLAERGTIAFFVRQEGMHYGFEPLVINTVDSYYWGMYTRLSNKDNSLSAWFPNEVYRPVVVSAGPKASLADGQWHHIAVAWDQAYGACYYFDGALVGTNWGKASWTSRGVDPDRIALDYSDGVAYDELYIFDRPLTDVQVQRLCTQRMPRPPSPNWPPCPSTRAARPTGWRNSAGRATTRPCRRPCRRSSWAAPAWARTPCGKSFPSTHGA